MPCQLNVDRFWFVCFAANNDLDTADSGVLCKENTTCETRDNNSRRRDHHRTLVASSVQLKRQVLAFYSYTTQYYFGHVTCMSNDRFPNVLLYQQEANWGKSGLTALRRLQWIENVHHRSYKTCRRWKCGRTLSGTWVAGTWRLCPHHQGIKSPLTVEGLLYRIRAVWILLNYGLSHTITADCKLNKMSLHRTRPRL